MSSGILELIVFSLPSLIYARRLTRGGSSQRGARAAVGLQAGALAWYGVALVLVVPVTALGALLLDAIPTSLLHGHAHGVVGAPSTTGDYVALILLALAEEMLFRGFLAGVLIRRLGFGRGNGAQAGIFLAPHLLLLLVSSQLWPLLPLQLASGWALGWLRARSGSVGPCWLAHGLTNLLPALLFGL